MTSSPHPDDPDTEGKTLPPYDDRKQEATSGEGSTTDDARTGGATGPVDDAEPKADDPEETERGATASPADEQPAQEESDDLTEGPGATTDASHTPGTGRAEDKP